MQHGVRRPVRHLAAFGPAPQALHRVELRGVGGQELQRDPVGVLDHPLAHGDTAVLVQAVPDQHHGARHEAAKVLQEANHVLRTRGLHPGVCVDGGSRPSSG